MSFTNKTPNLSLPQWIGSDKPQFLTDINGAFSAIDASIGEINLNQGQNDTKFEQINTQLGTLQTGINEAKTEASSASGAANAAQGTANNAVTVANQATLTAQRALENSQKGFKQFRSIQLGSAISLKISGTIANPTGSASKSFLNCIFVEKLNFLSFDFIIQMVETSHTGTAVNLNNYGVMQAAVPFVRLPMKGRLRQYAVNLGRYAYSDNYSAINWLYLSTDADGYICCYIGAASAGPWTATLQGIYARITTVPLDAYFDNIQLMSWTEIKEIEPANIIIN